MLIVTLYAGAFDSSPRPIEISNFQDLAGLIGSEHKIAHPNEKDKTPVGTQAFNPCEFDGSGRKIENVVRVHFGMVDIDKKPLEHVQRVLSLFQGIPTFAYSTYSHGHTPGVSMRLLFPFSRPVLAKEWEYYMAGFQAVTDKIIDSEKDPTRLFFVPVRRPERNDAFIARTEGARTFDVDACIAIGKRTIRAPVKAPQVASDAEFTLGDLKDVASTLRRTQKSASKEIAAIIDAIIDGKVYCEDNTRDATLFRVTGAIARYCPRSNPIQIAALFRQSVSATNAFHKEPDHTDDDLNKIVDKVTRHQAKIEQEEQTELDKLEDARKADIKSMFLAHNVDRDEPYTDPEIDRIKEEINASTEADLRTAWVVQNGSAYYVLTKFGYLSPVSKDELVTSARRDLAPAHTAGVELVGVNDDGKPVRKGVGDIMAAHGTVARGAIIRLYEQATYYDCKTQKIIEAPCPLRKLTPEHFPIVDDWLRALAGDKDDAYDKLRRWVAFVTRLDHKCVALYLDGERGVGKSLFAKGLSRLWTEGGATSMDNAIANFNDGIMKCPLVFADEVMPDAMRNIGTSKLREFQQNDTRSVNRKFIKACECVGCTRLILAANNKHMVESKEALTMADIDAISERVLYLQASNRARTVLNSLGENVSKLVDEDIIARHALYLASQPHKIEGRFMIDTGDHNISKSLTVHTGDRSTLIQWLVGYLQNPGKFNALNNQRIVIRDRTLYVQAQALVDGWETYVTNSKAPTTHRVSSALKGISGERHAFYIPHKAQYYPVKTDILYEWAIEHGISSNEEIDAALAKPTAMSSKRAVAEVKNPFTGVENAKVGPK